MDKEQFPLEDFVKTLGFRPWRYSDATYTDGAGRFLDWKKAERLLGLPHSDLLFSEYDPQAQRCVLRPFPAPSTWVMPSKQGWLRES
jgi:hypothetical protein